jgi:uncharacterized membrane protein YbhN (UPF0104 family)
MGGRRLFFAIAIVLATAGAFAMLALQIGHGAMAAATSPNWTLLAAAFAVSAGVQPLRALAWRTTLREQRPSFRAIYAASAVGSFLDTVLPARLGEASKVGVLRVAAGTRWPGFARAGGSLVCAHLLAGAAAPPRVLARAGGTLLFTWLARWGAIMLLLHAIGVHASMGTALLYMIVTGLANTAPLLPGNAGLYQGAAVGALALVGHVGAKAVAVGLVAPVLASVATAAAALVGIALYGRRFAIIPRAAFARN